MDQHKFNVKLFVGLCLTKSDWFAHKNSLILSLRNIVEAWDKQVLVFIVLQGDSSLKIKKDDYPDYIVFFETEFMGVSRARNLCIDKAHHICAEFMIFHDASIFWPAGSAKFISLNRYVRPKVKVVFSEVSQDIQVSDLNGWDKSVNPIYDTYVGSYLLKVSEVKFIRFNENFGPGQATTYKSGEDVLFLFEYFKCLGTRNVFEADTCYVFHPERPSSYDKHLTYASGQGKMFRILLDTQPSLLLYRDLILFFGNAIIRCLLVKDNSFRILKQRFIGFFDRGIN